MDVKEVQLCRFAGSNYWLDGVRNTTLEKKEKIPLFVPQESPYLSLACFPAETINLFQISWLHFLFNGTLENELCWIEYIIPTNNFKQHPPNFL